MKTQQITAETKAETRQKLATLLQRLADIDRQTKTLRDVTEKKLEYLCKDADEITSHIQLLYDANEWLQEESNLKHLAIIKGSDGVELGRIGYQIRKTGQIPELSVAELMKAYQNTPQVFELKLKVGAFLELETHNHTHFLQLVHMGFKVEEKRKFVVTTGQK